MMMTSDLVLKKYGVNGKYYLWRRGLGFSELDDKILSTPVLRGLAQVKTTGLIALESHFFGVYYDGDQLNLIIDGDDFSLSPEISLSVRFVFPYIKIAKFVLRGKLHRFSYYSSWPVMDEDSTDFFVLLKSYSANESSIRNVINNLKMIL